MPAAKKKKSAKKEEGESAKGFMDSLTSVVKDKYGAGDIMTPAEYEASLRVVPLPHLILQRLFGVNGVTMGQIIEFGGKSGSCKSAVAFYMIKMFLDLGYYAALVETENKLSPTLLTSVLGHEKPPGFLLFKGVTVQEEWQDRVTLLLKEYEKAWKSSKGAEKPFLIVIDSVCGALSTTASSEVRKVGHASKRYPTEALLNSTFFTNMTNSLKRLPVVILFTNHQMKDLSDDKGVATRTKGGDTPEFFCGYRFAFEMGSAVKKEANDGWMQKIRVKSVKNAFNQRGTMITVPMRWIKSGHGESDEKQETWFDWEESLANFLAPVTSATSSVSYRYNREKLKEFLTPVSKSEKFVRCKELVSGDIERTEFGRMLENDPELSGKLLPFLGVKNYKVHGT